LTDLLPAGDAYALGVDEGTKILENTDYVDQMNISVLPGATELINNLKSGQVTEERISQIANLYFPVAAVKAGILNISAENRAEFVRGMIDGYFPK
jgi:phosphosulfolactate synthase (CoM biosynthesis protein A)